MLVEEREEGEGEVRVSLRDWEGGREGEREGGSRDELCIRARMDGRGEGEGRKGVDGGVSVDVLGDIGSSEEGKGGGGERNE